MSHVTAIKTKFADLETLAAAAKRLGGHLNIGQQKYEWYGRYVGDSQLPQHLRGQSNEQLGRCDHAIKFPGAKYEVGVVETPDGLELRWDYWGPGGLLPILGGENAYKLVQAYALSAAQAEMEAQGLTCQEEVLADGTIRLVASGW